MSSTSVWKLTLMVMSDDGNIWTDSDDENLIDVDNDEQ